MSLRQAWPKRVSLAILLTMALVGSSLMFGPWLPGGRAVSITWRQVFAQDRSFVAQIPFDWQVTSAIFRNFTAQSPRGETITVGSDDVLADARSLQGAMTVCRQSGLYCQYRFWSPPLAPIDVVRVLFPRYASIQNVHVLGVWPLNVAGFRGALVRYKFIAQGGPLEGFAHVFTLRGLSTQVLRYWNFVVETAAGPRQYFRSNLSLYAAILDSLRYDPQSLAKIGQAPLKLGEELRGIDREFGRKWLPTLGGQVAYPCAECPGGQGTIPLDDLVPDPYRYDKYVCGQDLVPTPSGSLAPCPYGVRVNISW